MRKVAKNGFPSGMGVVIMRVEKLPSLTAICLCLLFQTDECDDSQPASENFIKFKNNVKIVVDKCR